jgi:protein-tyrosine kinase
MSRVFEALSKASADKKRQSEAVMNDAATEALAITLPTNGNVSIAELQSVNNGNGTLLRSLSPNGKVSKSWREKIEELLFGWDLPRYNSYPIAALEKDSPASEQYKILREQIKRFRTEAGLRAFTVTSPVKRDGKTTVAVNLAAVLALDYEENVLLIDGDLRAPNVHRYLNVPQAPGLTDYLGSNSRLPLKDLVHETFLPGLRILSSGKPSHLSSELLAKERMKQLMEEALAEFPGHQIIIDSPPVLSTPDPLVIARHVDGVLLVVRAGKTPRDYLTKALRSLNSIKIMGIVLNGAELGIASKYYYYTVAGA